MVNVYDSVHTFAEDTTKTGCFIRETPNPAFTETNTRILLGYFAGEKPLRMNQISRKFDPLRSNYCILVRIVC